MKTEEQGDIANLVLVDGRLMTADAKSTMDMSRGRRPSQRVHRSVQSGYLEADIERAKKLYNRILPICNPLEDSGMFIGPSKAELDLSGKTEENQEDRRYRQTRKRSKSSNRS